MQIVSSVETMCTTCQLQYYGKNKKKKNEKKNVNLSSAEFAQRAIKVNSIGGALVNG